MKCQTFNVECHYCGTSPVNVLTDTGRNNWANDGDEVKCPECGLYGHIVVDEEPHANVSWHDEPNCDCEWCKTHPE